jgi:serine-type D-Ala-D-Ala carboxypeptidase
MASVSDPKAKSSFRSVDKAFQEAVEQGVFPGAAVLAAKAGRIVLEAAYGFRSSRADRQRMQIDDVFDLASLTKPLATTTALMVLVREGRVALDDPVSQFAPAMVAPQTQKITLRRLLTHTSGLPAWRPYYQQALEIEKAGIKGFVGSHDAKNYIFKQVRNEEVASLPGTRGVYSDLGFILLGEIVEVVGGCALDQYCDKEIFGPLGLESTFFVDLNAKKLSRKAGIRFVPTRKCPWREQVLCGEVDDDNAYAMGGVAGHAGLFSCLHDLHQLLVRLRDCYQGKEGFLKAALVREFLSRDTAVKGWTYALGWDTPSERNSSSGKYFSRTAVGHLGFTGTSIWWDLEQDCHVILLNNRVHPTRDNDKISAFRPRIHDLIMERLLQ